MKKEQWYKILEQGNKFQIKKYPELDKLAMKISKQIGVLINKETKTIKSDMPYKAQYVLEKVIEILEEAV